MSTVRWRSLGIAILSVTACSDVRSTEPLGLEPAVLSPADWDGLWLAPWGAAVLTVTDSATGELRVTVMDGEPSSEIEPLDVVVRRAGDWLFANARENGSDQWSWMRITVDDGYLVAWYPDLSAFRSLVSAGDLPGEVRPNGQWTRGSVILDPLTAGHYERLRDDSLGVPLDWESPVAMIRFRPINE